MIKKTIVVLLSLFCFVSDAYAEKLESFYQAKKVLENEVYSVLPRITLYCEYEFDENKKIRLADGFYTEKHKKRADRVEWEHVVPAENFGRTFSEWRNGHELCYEKGKAFRGRKCAEKVNREFRIMQADMHNLYPAVGAVNASRSNYNFTQFSKDTPNSFGICAVKIYDRKVEPPVNSRGKIARAYLYMEQEYARYKMSKAQRQLMNAWNKMYPVTYDECLRQHLIEKIQGNPNMITKELCIRAGFYE